jgi:hypothetical protein
MTTANPRLKRAFADRRGVAEGYRSGLELDVATFLTESGYSFEYEPQDKKARYLVPAVYKLYLPDFVLPNGIIIETKGQFTSQDRKKQLLIRSSNPELDIRFVFNNPNTKIGKKSQTTYGMWCEKHGFLYHKFHKNNPIPQEWLDE